MLVTKDTVYPRYWGSYLTSCKIIVFFYMLLDSLVFTMSYSIVQGSLMVSHRSLGSFYSIQQRAVGINVESISVR
jgi:hypothetical protein